MKKYLVPILFLVISLTGCSGYLYTSLPPIEFKDIDYGYPTKTALENPSIAYIDEGKGEKTILLVHGLASNAGFWRYSIAELSKKYRVIAIDLPGYGKSQKDYYPYTISFFAEQINRLVVELKIDNFVLAGHSMGGQIAIKYSLKYPEKLEKLILVASAGFEEFERGEGDWLRSVVTVSSVKNTTEDGVRRNLAMNFFNWCDKWEWMVEERVRMINAKDFDMFAYTVTRSVNAMLDEPTFDKLSKISVPTLLIYGKYDGLIPNPYLNPGFTSDIFEWGAKQIPNSKIVEIDNCGHMIQIEKPIEFSNAVKDFIK
ncbi:MAG: alpha/beta hydrolase [Chlorobiaceae bacterium]|nr:alpha/beta hydrolase [Chlorobiaceae bacterium]MBA4309009.1 alpha/beta hydrolase [Chlorobiaceae bacterium]